MIVMNRQGLIAAIGLILVNALGASAMGQATERQKLVAFDAAAYDHFGGSVAINGDVAVVGAPLDDTAAGIDAGSAYVYRYHASTGTWDFEQQLMASDGATKDQFGIVVGVSGNVVAVGAPFHDIALGADAGAVYVYRFDGSAWVEEKVLASTDLAPGDNFGQALSMAGDAILVGAPQDDAPLLNSGSAYVFRYQGGQWRQEQRITGDGLRSQDAFGSAVALQDGLAVVGAPQHEVNANIDEGMVYVFRLTSGVWLQEQWLTAGDRHNFDTFGESLALSGDVIAIGATGHDSPGGADAGAVYMFRHRLGTWGQEQRLEAGDADYADFFGRSVALSGNLLVVGAPYEDGSGYFQGSAYFYRYSGQTCGWIEDTTRVLSDRKNGELLGGAVALGERAALVGAVADDAAAGYDTGSASVFAIGELELSITPTTVKGGDAIEFTTTWGTPGQAVMLVLAGINGSPMFQPLVLRAFDASYRWSLPAVFPGGLPSGTTTTFQSFKLAECRDKAIGSNKVTVTVR